MSATLAYFLSPARALILTVGILISTAVLALIISPTFRDASLLAGPFVLPFTVGACAYGFAIGALARNGYVLIALLGGLPLLYWIWSADYNETSKAQLLEKSNAFVLSEPRLLKMYGGPDYSPSRASYTETTGKGITRIEYYIGKAQPVYAIVNVTKKGRSFELSLACVTTLSMGARMSGIDACQQSTIELPPP